MEWLHTTIGTIELWQGLALIGVGVASGSLGGILGIGGGVVNIPMLSLLLGLPMHLAQAVSMTVTPFVAGASAMGHHSEHAVCVPLLKRLAPIAVLSIIGGVTASMYVPNDSLRTVFGVFLIWVALIHIRKLVKGVRIGPVQMPQMSWGRAAIVGGCFGFGAGLLGIGGGLITVPLLGIVCRLPLRQAIATSSAVMAITSIVGAIFKDATLAMTPGLPDWVQWWTPLEYAAWLIPSSLASSWGMAKLSHCMPLRVVRMIFVALVIVASVKLLS
jgi:uncharacterized membrane protein YfcA